MTRGLITLAVLLVMGLLKLPVEHNLAALHRQEHFRGVEFNLDLREKLGQLGFIAALSGFRAIVADALFIQAHAAWENTEWGRMLLLFRHITTLQPRVLPILGHGGVAHGLERERSRHERSKPAAPGAASQRRNANILRSAKISSSAE